MKKQSKNLKNGSKIMLPIISTPNPILLKKAERIKRIDHSIQQLIADMKVALAHADKPKGIGLAAPQVGVSKQLFIIKLDKHSPLSIFINPTIIAQSEVVAASKDFLEGCLSIPTIWGPVKRYKTTTVTYQDGQGKEVTETFTDLMATTIQHEVDHLHGILFTARVLEQGAKLYRVEEESEDGKPVFKEVEL